MKLPTLGITLGDVCGIGPEITIKALNNQEIYQFCKPVVIGDYGALEKAANVLSSKIPKNLNIVSVTHLDESNLVHGKPTKEVGKAAIAYVKKAVQLAKQGEIDGIITCPVNKAVINKAGIPFSGHTELLAKLTNTKRYAMLLSGNKVNVVLVTIHVPLKDVPKLISVEKVLNVIDLTHQFLKEKMGISNPKLAVTGLNPHAGEGGLIGREEEEIIAPAVREAKSRGLDIEGPLPSDTVFYFAKEGKYYVVICMYHDQCLAPFKMLHFRDGVNITMGLPIIRTSVDHGTAYDIAGKGTANPASLIAAIKMASRLISTRGSNQ